MHISSLLQEASKESLDSLKKTIQSDERVSAILKHNLKIEEIANPAEFLTTVKFYLLNNRNVQSFVEKRSGISRLDAWQLTALRQIKASNFTQDSLDDLSDFVRDLFAEHKGTLKGMLTDRLKSVLEEWFNFSAGHRDLANWAQKELMSLPVRPNARIRVYRGLLFSETSLRSRRDYEGTMREGNGLKFLKSVRDGNKIIDLEWQRASSWTTDLQTAEHFAKFRAAATPSENMMDWFEGGNDQRFTEGSIGFVISALVDPQNILVDTELLRNSLKINLGSDGEVVLKPGTYLAKVVKRYDEIGETRLLSSDPAQVDSIRAIVEVLDKLKAISIPSILGDLPDTSSARTFLDLLKNQPKLFKQLALDSTTTQLLHVYEKILSIAEIGIIPVKDKDIPLDAVVHDEHLRSRINVLKALRKELTLSTKLADSAVEFRKTFHTDTTVTINSMLRGDAAITDRSELRTSKVFKDLVSAVEFAGVPAVDQLADAFFKRISVDSNEDKTAGMINILAKVERNLSFGHRINIILAHLDG